MLINENFLDEFLKKNNAYFALVTNYQGKVVFSKKVSNENSIAAISAAIVAMCDKYVEDLKKTDLKQIILKTVDSILIFEKINQEYILIISLKSEINLGIIMHETELLAKNLNN